MEDKRMQGTGYGDDERDDARNGRHAAHDGEVNADGPTDGRCHHGVSVYGFLCYSGGERFIRRMGKAVEEEIVGFLKEKGSCEPSEIAAKLKISEESALYFIGKMAREKKVKIADVKL